MHELDDQGRIIASTPEVEWDDAERAWMVALADYESEICPGCGGLWSETTHPDADGAYVIEPPQRCHRCTTLVIARESAREHAQPEAMYPIVRKRGE